MGVAAIAPWFHLRLPSRPGFESQAHHLRFFQFVEIVRKERKRGREWPIFKKQTRDGFVQLLQNTYFD